MWNGLPADLQCAGGSSPTFVWSLPPTKQPDIAIIIGHGDVFQKQTKLPFDPCTGMFLSIKKTKVLFELYQFLISVACNIYVFFLC